jgi:hypothetical protein
VADTAGFDFPDKVGLAEQVLALCCLVIGLDAEAAADDRGGRENVPIEFVIVAITGAVADGQLVGQVIAGGDRHDIGVKAGAVDGGVAKEGVAVTSDGQAGL